jgi:hypothetical protein
MEWEQIMHRTNRQPGFRLWLFVAILFISVNPALAQAQRGTPVASPEPGAMQQMFGLLPAKLSGVEDPSALVIYYADVAAQLASVGVEAPESVDVEGFGRWAAATRTLAMPSDSAFYLNFWREDYGFDLLQADQTISVDLPPFRLSIYRGDLDTGAVTDALSEVGYAPVTIDGHELLSVRGDYEIDMDAATAYQLAAMNFGVVLDDRTLAFASAGAPLAAVLDVAAGTAPSMLDTAGVAMLLEHAPPDLASAVLVPGGSLAASIPPSLLDGGTPDISAIGTEMAEASKMPPVAMALLGSTVGGPLDDGGVPVPQGTPEARAVAVLLMLNRDLAEAAAPIIEERLQTGQSAVTGQPYTSFFSDWSVGTAEGAPVVLVDLMLSEDRFPNILVSMLNARDLGFLAW